MSWKMYQIKCDLLSPIHIGKRRYAYLQETYSYVPARVFIGAFIACYAKDKLNGDDKYEKAEKLLKENMRFSYFMPYCAEQEIVENRKNLVEHLQNTYVKSVMHTAIASGGRIADDGTLHEIEYITPYSFKGDEVHLWGYIFVKETGEMQQFNVLEYIDKITIGGERNNGWGKIKCIDMNEAYTFFHDKMINIVLCEEAPIIEYNIPSTEDEKDLIISYSHILQKNNPMPHGIIEPVIGRDKGKLTKAKICYKPFQNIKDNKKFIIRDDGLWERYE